MEGAMVIEKMEYRNITCPTCHSAKATLWINHKNPCHCDISKNYEYGTREPAPQPHGHGECENCNRLWLVPLTEEWKTF